MNKKKKKIADNFSCLQIMLENVYIDLYMYIHKHTGIKMKILYFSNKIIEKAHLKGTKN